MAREAPRDQVRFTDMLQVWNLIAALNDMQNRPSIGFSVKDTGGIDRGPAFALTL